MNHRQKRHIKKGAGLLSAFLAIGLALLPVTSEAGIANIITGGISTSTNNVAAAATNQYSVLIDCSKSRVIAFDISVKGVTNTPAQTQGTIQATTAVFAMDLSDGIWQSNAVRLPVTIAGTTGVTNQAVAYTNVTTAVTAGAVDVGGVSRFMLTAIENPSTNIIATNIVINSFTKTGE